MSKILCIYHGNCDDGFASAYIVREALGRHNVEFYPGVYQQEPPDVRGRDVAIVDFSYKRPVIETMSASARSLLILDHHKTAQADLQDFGMTPVDWNEWKTIIRISTSTHGMVGSVFDMERSGAGLTWDFFSGSEERPPFINYIEDRDLWKKQLPDGDEFTIALRSYPQTFEAWDRLQPFHWNSPFRLIKEGHSIQRYYRLRIEELKKDAYCAIFTKTTTLHEFHGHPYGAFVNAPYFAASELANEAIDLIEGAQFGACFRQDKQGAWEYSLRSRGDFDVSEIAKFYGGGGHKNAAGFRSFEPVHRRIDV